MSFRSHVSLPLVTLALAAAATLTQVEPAPTTTANKTPASALTPVEIRVTDAAGSPVTEFSVSWECLEPGAQNTTTLPVTATPSPDGLWLVPRPPLTANSPGYSFTRLLIRAPGFALSSAVLTPLPRPEDNARPLAFTLGKAAAVGGKVVNAAGEPVAGATVTVNFAVTPPEVAQARIKAGKSDIDGWHPTPIQTASDGTWTCLDVAADAKTCYVSASHLDYFRGEGLTTVPLADLQRRQAVTRLIKTRVVRGKVVDDAGHPLAGVTVWTGNRIHRLSLYVVTDADGAFHFKNVDPNYPQFLADKAGWAPERGHFIADTVADVVIKLHRSQTFRGLIVDTRGKPVGGAAVSLRASDNSYPIPGRVWPLSNADGSFEIEVDPASRQRLSVGIGGGATARAASLLLEAGQTSATLQLLPLEVKLEGTLVDSATGKPITAFRALAVYPAINGIESATDEGATTRPGSFSVTAATSGGKGFGVRIEADGYAPYISPDFAFQDVARALDENTSLIGEIRLHAAPNVTGRVVSYDSKPIADATIHVLTSSNALFIMTNDLIDDQAATRSKAQTDADGRFALWPNNKPPESIILSPAGWALQTVVTGEDIRLQPWSTLRVVLPAQPATTEAAASQVPFDVRVENLAWRAAGSVVLDLTPKRDTTGDALFNRLPGGPTRVSLKPKTNGDTSGTEYQYIDLPIWSEGRIIMAQGTASVTAHLVLPDAMPLNSSYSRVLLVSHSENPDAEPLLQLIRSGAYVSADRMRAYEGSITGKLLQFQRIEPGEYDLIVERAVPPAMDVCGYGDPVARSITRVSVKGPGETSLGRLVLEPITAPQVGDLAPDFEYVDDAGVSHRLSELRGKTVILDFWATWCGPCLAERDELATLYSDLAGRQDVQLLSVSLDRTAAPGKALARSKGLAWPQGWGGEFTTSPIPLQYGFRAIPAIFLISPDGHLLARYPRLKAVPSLLPPAH